MDRYASIVLGTAIDADGQLYSLGFSPQEGGYAFVEQQVDPLVPWHAPESAQVHRAAVSNRDDARAYLRSWATERRWIATFLELSSF